MNSRLVEVFLHLNTKCYCCSWCSWSHVTSLAAVMWCATGSSPASGGNISRWQEATTRLHGGTSQTVSEEVQQLPDLPTSLQTCSSWMLETPGTVVTSSAWTADQSEGRRDGTELQTKVPEDYAKFHNHGEGPYFDPTVSRRKIGTLTHLS